MGKFTSTDLYDYILVLIAFHKYIAGYLKHNSSTTIVCEDDSQCRPLPKQETLIEGIVPRPSPPGAGTPGDNALLNCQLHIRQ